MSMATELDLKPEQHVSVDAPKTEDNVKIDSSEPSTEKLGVKCEDGISDDISKTSDKTDPMEVDDPNNRSKSNLNNGVTQNGADSKV